MVWALSEPVDVRRATAFLAHEWTHATLTRDAPASGAGDPKNRWLEDGMCERVAVEVEAILHPRESPTTIASRSSELSANSRDLPERVDLLAFGTTSATTLFGTLAAQCEAGRLYGYAFALAFWLAADLSADELRAVFADLKSKTLPEVARAVAPAAFRSLSVPLACAREVLAGERRCTH